MTPPPRTAADDNEEDLIMTASEADPWESLLPAALVGTARRSVPDTPGLPAPDAPDAATALLDRAALAAVRRAAGLTPHTADPVEPAPYEDAPEVSTTASGHLAEILTARSALLPEWLGA
ncbi:DUF5691 domain-containing protein, partial [Nocardiopsis salina]